MNEKEVKLKDAIVNELDVFAGGREMHTSICADKIIHLVKQYHSPSKQEGTEWISADERLPEKDYTDVLILLSSGEVVRGQYCDDVDFNFTSTQFKAAHIHEKIIGWLPFPSSPAIQRT